jgi:Ca-activated chloride channel family protein
VRALALVALACALTGATWLDPHATAREASRLAAEGKLDEAAAKYREALIDDPDSALLQYNLADAAYRAGKYEDAATALGKIPTSDADPARTARVAYNLGNAQYRLGAAAEGATPQQALTHWAEALVAYRRAMGADPADEDAKFNHELVEKKIADLKQKLEEQQKDQQEKQQDQQPDQQDQQQQQDPQQGEQQQRPQDGEQKDEAQQEPGTEEAEQKPDEQPGDAQEQEQQAAQQPPQEPSGEQQGADGGDVVGDQADEEMSAREAEAILDGQRDQEMRPDEMMRQLQRGRVAEPREDW